MSKEHPHEGQLDKAEANESGEFSKEPMKQFKALTRRLLTISNKQLREEQARYSKGKTKTTRRKKT
jgi:hypothetical protein